MISARKLSPLNAVSMNKFTEFRHSPDANIFAFREIDSEKAQDEQEAFKPLEYFVPKRNGNQDELDILVTGWHELETNLPIQVQTVFFVRLRGIRSHRFMDLIKDCYLKPGIFQGSMGIYFYKKDEVHLYGEATTPCGFSRAEVIIS